MSDDLSVRLKARFGALLLDVDLTVPARGVTAIVGRSGAGKTILLRCIAGLERAEGAVRVRGEIWQDAHRFLATHRRAIGYVFQDSNLFTHLTLGANLIYGLKRARGRPGLGFDDVVALLELQPLLDRSPSTLSGGERQRGAIGRALLSHPQLLLMDEPTASLDAEAKTELLPYLERLHGALDLPILYVSHDASEVDRLADRVLIMKAGQAVSVDRDGARKEAEDRLNALQPEAIRALAARALLAGLDEHKS